MCVHVSSASFYAALSILELGDLIASVSGHTSDVTGKEKLHNRTKHGMSIMWSMLREM